MANSCKTCIHYRDGFGEADCLGCDASFDDRVKIADFFNVSLDWLMFGRRR